MDKRSLKFILFLFLILFTFNVIALYTLTSRVEDSIRAVDLLIEHVYKGG